MKSQTQAISHDVAQLAEDAHALLAATADMAGDKVIEARKRLSSALENGKEMYGRIKEKAVEGAITADEAMHEHPYKAIATGIGLGAIFGYLIARRCRCS